MENIMDIILTINLKGRIKGPRKHETYQTVSVDATPIKSRHPVIVTSNILHTDREEMRCIKRLKISSDVVKFYESEVSPYWVKHKDWIRLSKKQRLDLHLSKFDEGYGYTYEYIEHE